MSSIESLTEANIARLTSFLKSVKKNIALGNFKLLVSRRKNSDFLKKYGLLPENANDIILELTIEDYFKGPESDKDGHEGMLYIFKNSWIVDEATIYVKIRYNPPDEVVCISLHDDE